MPRKRIKPPRQATAKGARVVSAYLENAHVFRTAKGANPTQPAVLVLRRRPDFHKADFDRKAGDLVRLGREGKLVKTVSNRTTVTHRSTGKSRTRSNVYRDRIIRRLTRDKDKYQANKSLVQRLFRPKDPGRNPITGPGQGLDPDHIHDLQLGGSDTYGNLRLMDSWTNRVLGGDIATALRDVPAGTPVIVKVI
jgi:hypothetical protein